MIHRFIKDERGATAIEYGLICALIFLGVVTAIYAYRDAMEAHYQQIGDAVAGATN